MKMMGKYYHRTSILNSTPIFKYALKVLFAIVLIAMMYDIVFGEYDEKNETAWIAESQDADNDADYDTLVNRLQQYQARLKEENEKTDKSAREHEALNDERTFKTTHDHEDDVNKVKIQTYKDVDDFFEDFDEDDARVINNEDERQEYKDVSYKMNNTLNTVNNEYENNESYKILEEFRKYEELLDEEEDFELRANEPTDLIINTYMRSGSSFLGRIFSMRSDTFYVFEPLWNVQKFAYYSGMHELCHYYQHRCSKPGRDAELNDIGSSVKIHVVLDFMNSLMNCDFSKNKMFLPDARRFKSEFKNDHSWNFAKGQSWQTYFECSTRHGATYDKCLKEMQPVCRSKKHKVLKVLRTTLDNLEFLIKSRRSLKVIHLFRDPRGIINSHLHTPFFRNKVRTLEEIEKDVQTTCDRMRVDMQIALHLRRVYKGQFLVVQYEDFDDLLYNAKAMYSFMNMDISPEVYESLERLKNMNKVQSGFHPFSYSKSLPWQIERLVNKHCKGILQALGYPVFNSVEELRKFDLSPDQPKLPYSLSNSY